MKYLTKNNLILILFVVIFSVNVSFGKRMKFTLIEMVNKSDYIAISKVTNIQKIMLINNQSYILKVNIKADSLLKKPKEYLSDSLILYSRQINTDIKGRIAPWEFNDALFKDNEKCILFLKYHPDSLFIVNGTEGKIEIDKDTCRNIWILHEKEKQSLFEMINKIKSILLIKK